MQLLFVGDIVGKPGRDLVRRGVAALSRAYGLDAVIVNAENAAGGFGITRETGDAILASGVDVMTSGNHVWDKKEALSYISEEPRLLRPLNYPAGAPGRGLTIIPGRNGPGVAVINVMGRVHMPLVDNPFAAVLAAVDEARRQTPVIVVDFHAEATSEKVAFGGHLDGRVTAVVGTHTHVQTADERVLPGGTAYITDVGMTGPHDSVIGVEKEVAIARFVNSLPGKFDTATGDPRLHAVLIDADAETGRARQITRLNLTMEQLSELAERGQPGAGLAAGVI
jgi:metallophosphoesterase (TIGR00282 family)